MKTKVEYERKIVKMHSNLLKLYHAAVKSVNPAQLILNNVKLNTVKNELLICGQILDSNLNYHVIGFGKAVHGMAVALDDIMQNRIKSGVLSVPVAYPSTMPPTVKVLAGAKNNLPDQDSVNATQEIIQLITTIPEDDVIIVLISGGGSSLLCKPVPGISLQDKLLTIKLLVSSGADIRELNTVRKSLSQVKGGGLARLLEGRKTFCLILSDVVGNQLDVIASGATVGNSDAQDGAFQVIQNHRLEMKVPKYVLAAIKNSEITSRVDANIKNYIIGSSSIALESILQSQEGPKCKKICVSSNVDGLVATVAVSYLSLSTEIVNLLHSKNAAEFFRNMRLWIREHSSLGVEGTLADQIAAACEDPATDHIVLLMGGETTVQVSGTGKGGRNQELAVRFAKALDNAVEKEPDLFADWEVSLLSAGTDGIDGPTDAAGAVGCRDLIEQGISQGLDVDEYLANNDTYSYLSAVPDFLIKVGHTGTNVADIHLLSICKKTTQM